MTQYTYFGHTNLGTMAGLILYTYCVRYPHAMPFLNSFEHLLIPKTFNLDAV